VSIPPAPQGESGRQPPPLPPLSSSAEPLRVEALAYYTPDSAVPADWAVATRCRSAGQWHSLKNALAKAKIQALMNTIPESNNERDIELLVPKAQLDRADLIIKAHQLGIDWCPRCGSTAVKKIPLPWKWKLLDILLLGLLFYMPPRKECHSCGNRWG
jgi:hypothetical protein